MAQAQFCTDIDAKQLRRIMEDHVDATMRRIGRHVLDCIDNPTNEMIEHVPIPPAITKNCDKLGRVLMTICDLASKASQDILAEREISTRLPSEASKDIMTEAKCKAEFSSKAPNDIVAARECWAKPQHRASTSDDEWLPSGWDNYSSPNDCALSAPSAGSPEQATTWLHSDAPRNSAAAATMKRISLFSSTGMLRTPASSTAHARRASGFFTHARSELTSPVEASLLQAEQSPRPSARTPSLPEGVRRQLDVSLPAHPPFNTTAVRHCNWDASPHPASVVARHTPRAAAALVDSFQPPTRGLPVAAVERAKLAHPLRAKGRGKPPSRVKPSWRF